MKKEKLGLPTHPKTFNLLLQREQKDGCGWGTLNPIAIKDTNPTMGSHVGWGLDVVKSQGPMHLSQQVKIKFMIEHQRLKWCHVIELSKLRGKI